MSKSSYNNLAIAPLNFYVTTINHFSSTNNVTITFHIKLNSLLVILTDDSMES